MYSFSSAFLNPRPSCWMNTIADSVRRSMMIWLTEGMSIPSLKMFTENMYSISPFSSRRMASSRTLSESFPLSAIVRYPKALSSFDRAAASSFLLQKMSPLRFFLSTEYASIFSAM